MKLNTTLLFATTLALVLSCKKETQADTPAKTYANLEKASWFIGEWGNKSADGELTERWKKENDSVYYGESYFVVGGKDTVFAEYIELAEANGILAYTVTVPDQNKGESVRFEMTSGTDKQMIFENPKHDFPNKIVYNKVGNDSLVAEIFGTQKGKSASEKFAMKKQ